MKEGGILITGGSGAFGTAFVKHLLSLDSPPARIVVYSRGEYRQYLMRRGVEPLDNPEKPRLRFFIGDVRDKDRLKRALSGIEVVIHAAALKRIEAGYYNPVEFKKTNIDGSVNLIESAEDSGVQKVIFLSSDKAFQPVSIYGLTKAVSEAIFLAANNTRGWFGPEFSVCRYGNVWNSTGSVVPVWRDMLLNGDTVTVTDPDCTRFFMRMSEAVDLVMRAIEFGGKMHIPTLPAYRLGDLAEAMRAKMRIIGLPEWEKKHESMSEWASSDRATRMTVGELRRELDNV